MIQILVLYGPITSLSKRVTNKSSCFEKRDFNEPDASITKTRSNGQPLSIK